ncbi:hypothetical protein DL770_002399 [Monosporascus sp. CRB-9-2]|nr:hypothetical protein DL770_002399 [Monosporascus sp. CRB-9-2]
MASRSALAMPDLLLRVGQPVPPVDDFISTPSVSQSGLMPTPNHVVLFLVHLLRVKAGVRCDPSRAELDELPVNGVLAVYVPNKYAQVM